MFQSSDERNYHIFYQLCTAADADEFLDFHLGTIIAMISAFSLCFNSHFPDGTGLAGIRMSPSWILLELRMMELVMTTGAVRRAKLQSKCHHQQSNTQFFTGRMPFLSLDQLCQSTEGKPQFTYTCECTHACLSLNLPITQYF